MKPTIVVMLFGAAVALIAGVVGVSLLARGGNSQAGSFLLFFAGGLLVVVGLDYVDHRNRRR